MATIDWQQRALNIDLNIHNFISGEYAEAQQGKFLHKYSPRDGSFLYRVPVGTPAEMESAILSANLAYRDNRWSGLTLHQRQTLLRKLADLLDIHQERIGLYECLDTGKPITQALGEVAMASGIIRAAVNDADKVLSSRFSDGAYCTYQIHRSIGIVGAIIPWNYPLVIAAKKIGAALVMGNSLVLKPSEYTCLSISYLAYLALEAGIPSGVLNVVHGIGRTVGSVLAHHKDVGLLSFTGSSATGKLMQIAAGQSNMKRLLLECGGKSPYIVFDDCPADLDMLADDIVAAAFHNQSQNCMAGSRLIIQSKIKETLLPKITEKAAQYVPQDTLDPSATFGALIHQDHMENVLSFIDSGKKQGARLIQGGNPVRVDTGKYSDGFYVEPTIFDEVKSTHKIAQEEIFGPVLATMEFDAEEEAIELANNSQYGLAAYVATMDAGRIQRVSQNVNAGSIMFLSTSAPSDVMKELGREGQLQSGFGAEGGVPGLLAYTLNTSVHHWT